MEEFEKIEELVRVTGSSFEDATNALRACDGNIVDAMVYLEKLGKLNTRAAKTTGSTVDEKCKKAFEDVKKPAGKFVDFMAKNKLNIKKGDDTFATVPVGAAAVLGLVAPIAIPAAFVSMMCGYEYSFSGNEAGVDKANEVMGKAEEAAAKAKEAAEKAKDEFDKI